MSAGKVLDAAAGKDARALYAGLQAALLVIIDLAAQTGRIDKMAELEAPILRALEVGDTYGSAAHLASIEYRVHPSHRPETPDDPTSLRRYCDVCGRMIVSSDGVTASGTDPCEGRPAFAGGGTS